MASGGPERREEDGAADWALRPPRRIRLVAANDNGRKLRGPDAWRRLIQSLLLAAAAAAILILARGMR